MNRRHFLQSTAGAALATPSCSSLTSAPDALIIDTHQHLWDRHVISPPWLAGAPEVLRHDYRTAEYLKATEGLKKLLGK